MRKSIAGRPIRALHTAQRRILRRSLTGWMYPLLTLGGLALLCLLVPKGSRGTGSILLSLILGCGMSVASVSAAAHEKQNGLLPAYYISGIKPGGYLFSKCLYAALPAFVCGCIVLWFGHPDVIRMENGALVWSALLRGDLPRLGLGAALLVLIALCSVCLAMIPALVSASVSGYSFGAGLLLALLLGPAVWDSFSALPQGFRFHPLVLAGRLMRAPDVLSHGETLKPLLLPLAALLLFFALSLGVGLLCSAGLLHGKGGDEA